MPQYEFNLRDYLRVFHKRKFVIIATFLAVIIGSAVYVYRQPLVYEATTTVKIEERKTIAGLLTEWIVYSPADIMESQTKIIKGFPIMKKVALRLGLIGEGAPTSKVHSIVAGLQGSITTETVGRTNIIKITASANDAKEVMDLANAVADVYVEENLLEKTRQARSALHFIEEQLSKLEDRLRDREERLRKFGDEIKVRDIKLVLGSVEPIQKKLIDLEFELTTLLQRYTDKHPRVTRLKKQIKGLELRLKGQTKDLKAQQKGFSEKELEYARLAREVEVNKKLYTMFKEKLEEARITEAQTVGDVSIVDPAVMPTFPIGPKREMGMLIGGLMGLILGLALAFMVETLDTSISTIEDIENVVKLHVLGVVPSTNIELEKKNIFTKLRGKIFPVSRSDEAKEAYIRLIVHHEPKSHVAEAYRNIRTNLKLDSSRKTILITSAGPLEGKSTTVVNLALTTAQGGAKTLLVSTDLRRPTIAKTFGIKREPGLNEVATGAVNLEEALKGISDIMLGDMKFDEIMKFPGMENMWILTSGQLPPNPAEILESERLTNLIKELKKRFDVIFLDSPPVLPVTDACLLGSKVDGVVLCYEIGRTPRNALLRAKIQLESVGAKILGVVLNHVKPQTEFPYPYYTYKYRYRYRYDEKDKIRQETQGREKG